MVIENQLAAGNNVGQLNRDVVTVNVDSKTERAVPNFEETLKGIDEELFKDCVISNLNTLKSGGGSGDKSDGAETSGEKQMANNLDKVQAWHLSNSSVSGAMKELIFNADYASMKQEKRTRKPRNRSNVYRGLSLEKNYLGQKGEGTIKLTWNRLSKKHDKINTLEWEDVLGIKRKLTSETHSEDLEKKLKLKKDSNKLSEDEAKVAIHEEAAEVAMQPHQVQ